MPPWTKRQGLLALLFSALPVVAAADEIDKAFGNFDVTLPAVTPAKRSGAAGIPASGGMPDISDDDLFRPAPQAATGSDKKTPDDFFAQLLRRAAWQLEAYATYYPMPYANPTVSDASTVGWGKLQFSSRADLTPSTQFAIKMHAVGSSNTEDHQGAFTLPRNYSNKARHLDLSTLSLAQRIGDNTITMGKAPLAAGLATLYSPADRYDSVYAADPSQAFKNGRWQLRLDRAIGDDTATLAVLPSEDLNMAPHPSSRWFGTSSVYAFSTLPDFGSVQTREHHHDLTPRNWGWLGKYKGTESGVDYFLLGHYGPSVYSVIRRPDLRTSETYRPMAATLATGLATTIDRWEVHGEASYQLTQHNHDQDFVKYVVGFSYRDSDLADRLGMDEIQPIIEYAGELVTDQQGRSNGYVVNSANTRPLREAALGRVIFRISDAYSAYVGGSQNFVDGDFAVFLGGEYKYSDDLKFKLDLAAFEGETDTLYGRWRRNDYIRFGVVATR